MFNIRHTGRKSLLAVIFCISLGALLPLTGWSANLLQNDGLEPPFTKYGTYTVPGKTFDLEVAHDWNRYFIAAGTPDSGQRFYFFRSSALEFLYGFTEKRDGVDAQVFWSTDPFDGGIYQQLSGLTVGEHYGFQAGTLQVYANTTSKTHNMMFRSVGIDPTGGTDPGSPNVVWSPEEGRDVAWFYPGVGATAKSPTMTVFVRIRSPRDAPPLEENSVWVDDTYFDIAPQTSLSLSLDSTTQATASWNGTPRVGYSLYAYEAQYRKTTDTDWTDLQVFASNVAKSTATSRSFTVEPGAEYVVRARTWHEQIGGDSHEIPGPWAEATIVSGGLVRGKVLNNLAQPVNGATVQVSGFPLTSTTTSSAGDFELRTGSGTFHLQASAGTNWTTPAPVKVTVPSVTATTTLSITLRHSTDIVHNGDFEAGLTGWQFSGDPPVTTTQESRAGSSLQLTGSVTISQTGQLTGTYHPILSFWYKLTEGDGTNVFSAELMGDPGASATAFLTTGSFSTTTAGDWQFAWLPLNLTEVYTGSTTIQFALSQTGLTATTVYLDEVSLGAAPGGPNKVFLPILLKN